MPDPIATAFLQQLEEAGMPPLNEMSPEDARLAAEGFIELAGPPEDVDAVDDRTVPGTTGEVPVRIYTPAGAGDGPLPCLVYLHGGGWVLGDLESVDSICRIVANRSGCKVVSVDYPLAPEFKFPAPLNDCYAVTEWVAANAASIGVDPDRLAIGGDSAGGNLSAAVALRARDEDGPALRMQVLVYPVTDHYFGTASYDENADGYLLTQDMMRWFWDHYLVDESQGEDPLASPLRASDLSGLPPAYVITAEFDPLRDEGEAFAARLAADGVTVTHKRYDGHIHAFWQMPGVFPTAATAAEDVAAALKAAMT